MSITILTEQEIRQCVAMDLEAIQVVEQAFSALSQGKAMIPPIIQVEVEEHHGEVDVKTAYIQGLDSFAIKIASGYYENYKLGLPSGSGMMILVDAKTGRPIGVLLDNGYLTDVRTAAAGAIAAKYLAPEEVDVAGVLGSGIQARYQLRALKLVRDFSRLLVFGPTAAHVGEYVEDMQSELGIPVERANDAETVVREAQVLVTTTPSKAPLVKADWLHSGLHITAMGSDSASKQELEAGVLKRASRLVCDLKRQCFQFGELHHGLELGVITEEDMIDELGDLTSGKVHGRTDRDEITVCDLTGVGIQDTAIARLAYAKGKQAGFGLEIS